MKRDDATVRDETAADVGAIAGVTETAFRTLALSSHTEHFIVAVLRAVDALTLSLVAEEAGCVVGHIAFSPVIVSDGTPGWYGLGPVSVLPERQRRGIGGSLIKGGLARLRALGARGCCLVGHPDYYPRFGFRNAEGLGVDGVPPEAFFVLPFDGPVPRGTVRFHEAFGADARRVRDIVRHHDPVPGVNPWVHGGPREEKIEVVPHDPGWPALFERLAGGIRAALGGAALALEHVGSTAVPGLEAKPVIDIDLAVEDPDREDAYVPRLEKIGYDLTIREPHWHRHRCFRLDAPRANLHVFAPGCPETVRHILFRNRLRRYPGERELYARAKRAAGPGARSVEEYNRAKQAVIREIYGRAFRAAGLIVGPGDDRV